MPCFFVLCFLAMLVWIGQAEVNATTLIDSYGFESPRFGSGGLAGQDGWGEIFLGNSASTAEIQTGLAFSGSAALRVDRRSQSEGFWAKDVPTSPSGRFVSIDWDMRVEPTGSLTAFGPFFGVQVINDRGSNQIDQLGSFGLDASTGEIIYEDQTGAFAIGQQVALGEWHHFRIELDFGTQSYRALLGEQVVAQSNFVDSTMEFTNADIVGRAAAGDLASRALEGTAYFDNYLVRDGVRGDYNNDGMVDAADYTIWRDTLGQNGSGLAADGNADGTVDTTDYQLWQVSYGIDNAISSISVAIPEPTTASLLMLVFSLAPARWHRLI